MRVEAENPEATENEGSCNTCMVKVTPTNAPSSYTSSMSSQSSDDETCSSPVSVSLSDSSDSAALSESAVLSDEYDIFWR